MPIWRESSASNDSVSLCAPADRDTNVVTVFLQKENKMEWWKQIAEGEPEIDTQKVRCIAWGSWHGIDRCFADGHHAAVTAAFKLLNVDVDCRFTGGPSSSSSSSSCPQHLFRPLCQRHRALQVQPENSKLSDLDGSSRQLVEKMMVRALLHRLGPPCTTLLDDCQSVDCVRDCSSISARRRWDCPPVKTFRSRKS